MATPAQLKLASKLLELASHKFSHHVCNDFCLIKDGGLTPTEAVEIQELVNASRRPEDREEASLYADDWILMSVISNALEGKEP